ncbi:TPA: EAL domain-containing protein [Yersinia enterocolitica]|nr:EAL domain-containing protein [Yersinia enterocolitica]HDL7000878.1 EAL domain-containing protein [Yersinia enterocolitica]HDL7108718.1 EAL domain-containing protein [Yersinia enterocolitica]HDL7117188.1 EAL domain-containing protein [Yersinia enterocolitica]
MITQYFAQPVMSTDQKLLGVEVLTKFQENGFNVLNPAPAEIMQGWSIHEKRAYLIDLIHFISNEKEFFLENKLFCSLNIDQSTALILRHDAYIRVLLKSMPYVKLQISEDFIKSEQGLKNSDLKSLLHGSNALFLNYLGIGNVNVKTDVSTMFEVVKIDETLFGTQFYRSSFPVLLKDIMKYCPRIIVSGVFDTEILQYLKEWCVWGVQGEELYESIPLQDVSGLL